MAAVPIEKRDKGPPSFIVLQGTICYGAFIKGAEFRDYGPPQEPRGIIDPRDTMEGITDDPFAILTALSRDKSAFFPVLSYAPFRVKKITPERPYCH